MDAGERLREYVPPAPRLPELSMHGRRLTPSAYQWRVAGEWTESLPQTNTDVSINRAFLGKVAAFRILGDRPDIVRVQLFDRIPSAEDGESRQYFDCAANDTCSMVRAGGEYALTVADLPSWTRMMTLTLVYPTFEEMDEQAGISAYTASWVVREDD